MDCWEVQGKLAPSTRGVCAERYCVNSIQGHWPVILGSEPNCFWQPGDVWQSEHAIGIRPQNHCTGRALMLDSPVVANLGSDPNFTGQAAESSRYLPKRRRSPALQSALSHPSTDSPIHPSTHPPIHPFTDLRSARPHRAASSPPRRATARRAWGGQYRSLALVRSPVATARCRVPRFLPLRQSPGA